ncbi:unnamed protein product [Bathycoccus prasinos]
MSSSIELSNSEEVKAFPPTVIYIIENKDIFYVGMRILDYKLEGGTLKIKNREVCVRYKGNPVFSHGGLGSTGGVYGLERWLGKLRGKILYGFHFNIYRSAKAYEDIVKKVPYFKEKWATHEYDGEWKRRETPKTKSIPNLKFKDLGNDAFSVSTPTEHISLNSVILLVAKKQSGKTFFASNLMNQLKQVKACDRIFVISDTFNSNKKMMEHLDIKREDIFSPNDPNVIPEITKRIEAERDDLLEYRQNLKMYNQYRQTLEQANRYDTDITEEMLLFYNPDTGRFEKPKHKYNGRKPAIFIFCDDIQSSQLVGDRKFRNFVIKHRHIGAFENGEPPIGCSMIIAVQNYTTQGNEGLPKAIRGNANCVAVWKTGNVKELDLLATELSGQIPKKDILDAYEYAMNKEPGNRHNFLFIDLTPKKEHPSPFRFNYNEWILH